MMTVRDALMKIFVRLFAMWKDWKGRAVLVALLVPRERQHDPSKFTTARNAHYRLVLGIDDARG